MAAPGSSSGGSGVGSSSSSSAVSSSVLAGGGDLKDVPFEMLVLEVLLDATTGL
jgi:hypothetical protein